MNEKFGGENEEEMSVLCYSVCLLGPGACVWGLV